ncbi:leucyl aminopeptidase [Acidipila sp. EB88]|uniref:leucyl aminopeptidase n=1 Tax=Acidipila sp. EB88 TaxID=2305226 RepID=UPI000F5E4462|nr:leucyl aminopeptidase [Acidipila sp. EB88]RRA47375.1 leucyl aminopeptidase [Acidipila sp. EB88]
MKTELKFALASATAAELLVIFTVDQSVDGTPADIPAVFPLTESQTVHDSIGEILTSGEFRSTANETLLIHQPKSFAAKRVLLVGIGKAADPASTTGPGVVALRKAAGTAARYAKSRGLRALTIALPQTLVEATDAEAARTIAEGVIAADFDPDTYRSDRKDQSLTSLTLLGSERIDQPGTLAGFEEGVILGESQNFARALINEPGNVLTPTVLGERAKAMCDEVGLTCEVYSTAKLEELKMGAFLGVTRGSAEPPALIVAHYEPANPTSEVVLGLVGKAITFDTGGISIKPADGMEKMKYDMAGGAAMLGAIRAIALLKPNVRVLAVICSAENMPSSRAYKPGDVLTAMSGKTIEVINTDAEGRLVLADGLHYAKQLGATHLIDAATLTGAVGVALGVHNAGAFASDEATWAKFEDGLKLSGERFWRLPLHSEYREQIKSHIADLMNTGGRYGGAITAAMFLKEFAGDTPWIHLDIAGLAWLDDAKGWISKGPSGVAVRSIVAWVQQYA